MTATMVWVLAQRYDFPNASSAVKIEQLSVFNSVLYHRLLRLYSVKTCTALSE